MTCAGVAVMNVAVEAVATALTSVVLLHPGGPWSIMPLQTQCNSQVLDSVTPSCTAHSGKMSTHRSGGIPNIVNISG